MKLSEFTYEGADDPDSTVGPAQDRAQYDQLPEGVKMLYSFKQYMWLSSNEKAGLIARETMPDVNYTD